MIKYFCDVCGAECPNDGDSALFKIDELLCYDCHRELSEFYRNMLRRNPKSYIHEIDKMEEEYREEKLNDTSLY